MNHPIRLSSAASEALQIRKRAPMDRGACRDKCLRPAVRTGQTEYLMAGGDQIPDDGRPDPAGGSSDKYTHEQSLQVSFETTLRQDFILVK